MQKLIYYCLSRTHTKASATMTDNKTFHDTLLVMVANITKDFPSLLSAQVFNPVTGLPFGAWRYGPRGLKAMELLERLEKGESFPRLLEELAPDWYSEETYPIDEQFSMAVAEGSAYYVDEEALQARMDEHVEVCIMEALPFAQEARFGYAMEDHKQMLSEWLRSCELLPSGHSLAPSLSSKQERWIEG